MNANSLHSTKLPHETFSPLSQFLCHGFADMCHFCFSGLVLLTAIRNGPVICRFCIRASSIQTLEIEDYNAKYI